MCKYFIIVVLLLGSVTPASTQITNTGNYRRVFSGTTYRPGSCTDIGTVPTTNCAYAYANVPEEYAFFDAYVSSPPPTYHLDTCVYSGFASYTTTTTKTLYVTLSGTAPSPPAGSVQITFDGGSTWNVVYGWTTAFSTSTVTYVVPLATNLANTQVKISLAGAPATANVYDINIH
jgi:hypothetical protein